jgi:excisionase family DNA binding protein
VANLLDTSERYVWRMVATGRLRAIKLGPGTTRIVLEDLEAMIAAAASRNPQSDEGPPQSAGLVKETAGDGDRSQAP